MMNGLVIKRGDKYLARKGCKSARPDASGNFWSAELQAARVFMNHDAACRAARKFGGVVKLMKNGKAEVYGDRNVYRGFSGRGSNGDPDGGDCFREI